MVLIQREESVIASQIGYLKYLPAIYSEDEFFGRFLMIFESVLGPVEEMVDNLAYYFDPGTSPEELLPWLASWMEVEMDPNWDGREAAGNCKIGSLAIPVARHSTGVEGVFEAVYWH